MENVMKFLAYNEMVKMTFVDTTEAVKKAKEIHEMSKTVTAAFAKVLTMATIMGADLKQDNDNITLQIKGNGPIGQIICVAKKGAKVKGYVQNQEVEVLPTADNKLDVKGIIGNAGYIYIIKDLGLKEPYIGITQISEKDISEDFVDYYIKSEQIPTAISLGILFDENNNIEACGGYLIQLMPDATEEVINRLEENLKDAPSISKMINDNMSLSDIAMKIIKDENMLTMLGEIHNEYACDCSYKRMEKGIISLGKKEIEDIISGGKNIEIKCQFCSKKYNFTIDDLKNMI